MNNLVSEVSSGYQVARPSEQKKTVRTDDSELALLIKHIATLCQTSMAFIGEFTENEIIFNARYGLPEMSDIPLSTSLCASLFSIRTYLEVANAGNDRRCKTCTLLRHDPDIKLYVAVPLFNADGEIFGAICVLDNCKDKLSIHQRESLLQMANFLSSWIKTTKVKPTLFKKLHDEANQMQFFFDKSPSMQFAMDQQLNIVAISDVMLNFLGYSREEVVGYSLLNILCHDSRHRFQLSIFPMMLEASYCSNVVLRFTGLIGRTDNLLYSANVVTGCDGNYILCNVTPTTTQTSSPHDFLLHQNSGKAALTLHTIADGVISINKHFQIDYLNPAAELLVGWSIDEAIGKPVANLFGIVNSQTLRGIENPLVECLNHHRAIELPADSVLLNRYNEEICIESSATPIVDSSGNISGAVMVLHDVSKHQQLQQQMRYQFSHDHLTGLINSKEFETHLQHALRDATDHRVSHTVCFINLDDFAAINETYSYLAGDELLRRVSSVMQDNIRKQDALARLNGDEFAVLLWNCPEKQAELVAENLRQAIQEFRFLWKSNALQIHASIGLVTIRYPVSNSTSVMRSAEVACQIAKLGGRNQVYPYTQNESPRRNGEAHRATQLPDAFKQNNLQLYAQKIVPIANTATLNNIEILVRLKGEYGELTDASSFMPAAERYHYATAIDRWYIADALEWLTAQEEFLSQLGYCSINLSAQSLSDSSFQRYLLNELDKREPVVQKLCFEITEAAAFSNLSRARKFLLALRERGCLLTLNDFGSGLSSFGYLRNFPVDILKIDGTLIRSIVKDEVSQTFVRTIHSIAQQLGKVSIAKGVEDIETWRILKTIGIHYAQGDVFDSPEPLTAMASNWSMA